MLRAIKRFTSSLSKRSDDSGSMPDNYSIFSSESGRSFCVSQQKKYQVIINDSDTEKHVNKKEYIRDIGFDINLIEENSKFNFI